MGFVEMGGFFSTKPLFNKTHVDKKQGKWVLLKWFFFQQNPFQQKSRKMGFSFNKTHLSEVYKNQKNCRASIFKLQATDCCAYAFEGIGILVSLPTHSPSNVCLCP
jgi:hypothetical protein